MKCVLNWIIGATINCFEMIYKNLIWYAKILFGMENKVCIEIVAIYFMPWLVQCVLIIKLGLQTLIDKLYLCKIVNNRCASCMHTHTQIYCFQIKYNNISCLSWQELVVALSGLIQQFETQFVAVAYQFIEEERQAAGMVSGGWNLVPAGTGQ